MKKLLITLIVITLVAVMSFQLFKPEKKIEEKPLSRVVVIQNKPQQHKAINSLPEQSEAELSTPKKVDTVTQQQIPQITPSDDLVNNLATDDGLHQNKARQLIANKEFAEKVSLFEKKNDESYEIQEKFQQVMQDTINKQGYPMVVTSFNCNDFACAAAISYENEDNIDPLINQVFDKKSTPPVGMIVQPVLVSGNKELRVVWNFKNPAIIL